MLGLKQFKWGWARWRADPDLIWDALNVARDNKGLVATRDGVIVNLNEQASDLCGRSRDELAGRSIAELLDAGTLKTAAGPSIPVEVTRHRVADLEVYAIRDQ